MASGVVAGRSRRGVLGVTAVGVAVLLSSLAACGIATKRFSDDASVGGTIHAVRIESSAGSVRLRVGPSASVHRTVSYLDGRPGVTHRVEGDVLVLRECEVRNCWVDYEVVVPEGVTVSGGLDSGSVDVEGASTVNLRVSSGEVKVRRVSGAVNVKAESGSVDLVDVKGKVAVEAESGGISARDVGAATLRSESGSVDAQGVDGAVDASAQSGSVTVRLSKAAGVKATTNSGSVQVTVPKGEYRVSAHTDSGDVDNGIGDYRDSPNHLELNADSGDVTVRFG
ncbi:Putative adhesin [Actinokineospora terrae]|uniref:Putative adhesin n=1 Tax=Actinokineospora terrae TaxID=155974 RepID=A0A1H9W2T0_9PSEU|nr:Putative adhesin [Actinokineospora terrae]